VGLVISPESALGIELAKWEQTAADRDPIKHRYPMMLYMAREVNGRGRIDDPHDEAFAQKCQLVVPNEFEEQRALANGWSSSPQGAIDAYEAKQKAWADEAANAAWHAQRMTEKSRREFQQAEDATHQHVVDVQPVKKRGRGPNKPKIKPVTVTAQE
jgi:hypothetical protein